MVCAQFWLGVDGPSDVRRRVLFVSLLRDAMGERYAAQGTRWS